MTTKRSKGHKKVNSQRDEIGQKAPKWSIPNEVRKATKKAKRLQRGQFPKRSEWSKGPKEVNSLRSQQGNKTLNPAKRSMGQRS